MIAVQTIRAHTACAPAGTAMTVTNALALSMRRSYKSSNNSSYSSIKRKRDCWEAFDYQMQKNQKMRCSLLREENSPKSTIYPRDSLEEQASNDTPMDTCVMKRHRTSQGRSLPATNSNDDLRKQAHKHLLKMQKEGSKNVPRSRQAAKLTKKLYNKKKRHELMEATSEHIQGILGQSRSQLSREKIQTVKYLRYKAEQYDRYLRYRSDSIVQKEKDIKLWLSLRTSNKRKIVKLTKKLHQRWGEVKDIQSEVKPHRLRLKNLKFAMLCAQRSIIEEEEDEEGRDA